MKSLLIAIFFALVLATCADVVSTSTTNQAVVFTNSQANVVWSPTALLIAFPAPVTSTVSVARQGNGVTVTLAATSITNAQSLVWNPASDYLFPQGTSLAITAAESNFTAQLHRKAAP